MELNQALKKLATHGQKWHFSVWASRAACTPMLLRKTLVHVQWLRGHEKHPCIICGEFWWGLYSCKYRVKSQSLEDLGQVCPTLNETVSNEAHTAIWEMPHGTDTKDGWNFCTDIFPQIEIAFVEIYSGGLGCISFYFFPFSSLLVVVVEINKWLEFLFVQNWKILFLIWKIPAAEML